MRIFKTTGIQQWARKEGIADDALRQAITGIGRGLVEANPGGSVYKKRVVLSGRGKRDSARTLVAFRRAGKAFFIYGFAKNRQANVKENELKALKLLASQLLGYTDAELAIARRANELIEVPGDE